MPSWKEYPENRLFSLDLLRGLDMLLLTVITPVVVAFDRSWKLPDCVMKHCTHVWNVLSLHDVIMPCFIFMCGAAIPFALGRRLKDGKPTKEFWTHVLSRFALLYVLGSIVQCNLLSFDPMKIHVFYNTLQVIGVAYVATALVMLIPSRLVQMAMPAALLAAMGLIVHFCGHGDYTQTGNFAYRFDRMVWGLFLPEGQHSLKPNGYYCYLLPQLAGIAITMLGYECALVLKGAKTPWAKAELLFGLAATLILSAWLVSLKVPVIKHIFSLSFSLYTAGWSVLALGVAYVATDIWKFRRGSSLVLLFGQNALAAYMIRQMFNRGIGVSAEYFTRGVPFLFGKEALPFANGLVSATLFTLLLMLWCEPEKAGKRCRDPRAARLLSPHSKLRCAPNRCGADRG